MGVLSDSQIRYLKDIITPFEEKQVSENVVSYDCFWRIKPQPLKVLMMNIGYYHEERNFTKNYYT